MSRIEKHLAELGIVLPQAMKPIANYVPWVRTGNLVFVSGQGAVADGKVQFPGQLGADVSIEDGRKAARMCGLSIIAQLKDACGGDLDKIRRIVKLVGFVNAAPGFTDHPKVVNGASDLMVEVFGDKGRHARSAVGSPSLPLNLSVEVEAIAEID
jgi:enamine deaminase RidA (YjgF/YER057c/UK114 family)